MCAEEPGLTTEYILRYYKIASPEKKQSIDSLFTDMEAPNKATHIRHGLRYVARKCSFHTNAREDSKSKCKTLR